MKCTSYDCSESAIYYVTVEGDNTSYPYCDECSQILVRTGERVTGSIVDGDSNRIAHLEKALKHLREFVHDGEVRRVIDCALDGKDWE